MAPRRRRREVVASDIFTCRFNKVPVEIELSEIVTALLGQFKTIMGIHRVFDYENQTRVDCIFLHLRSEVEYDELKLMRSFNIRNHIIEINQSDWHLSSAVIRDKQSLAAPHRYYGSPVNLKLGNLTKVSIITSIYLKKLLLGFEYLSSSWITGLNFSYDDRQNEIRPFGFMSFVNRETMLTYHRRTIRILDENITCEECYRIPIVVSAGNRILLRETPPMFSDELKRANCLHDHIEVTASSNQHELERAISSLSITEAMEDDQDKESVLSLDCDEEFDD